MLKTYSSLGVIGDVEESDVGTWDCTSAINSKG